MLSQTSSKKKEQSPLIAHLNIFSSKKIPVKVNISKATPSNFLSNAEQIASFIISLLYNNCSNKLFSSPIKVSFNLSLNFSAKGVDNNLTAGSYSKAIKRK